MIKSNVTKWLLFCLVCCFAVYWLSNLVLWYPWSINETLGQIIMLTINPVLRGYASYICIVQYPEKDKIRGVLITSIIFTLQAILSDFVFFVLIRHASDKIVRPTTFYAWGFVLCLSWIVFFLFRKRILTEKKSLKSSDFKALLQSG